MFDVFAFLIPLVLSLALLAAVLLTAWWLWRRATLPEGAPPPKWGDLRPLQENAGRGLLVLRAAAVAVLALLMSLPLNTIQDLMRERFQRYREVVAEISASWGQPQTLTGPVLVAPYTVRYTVTQSEQLSAAELALEQAQGSTRTHREVQQEMEERHTALVLPEELTVDGGVTTELRRRSIYSARVYAAELAVSGVFRKPDLTGLRPHIAEVHWSRAALVVGLSDTGAIRGAGSLNLAGRSLKFLPGTGGLSILPTGFSAEVNLAGAADGEALPFQFNLDVGGSQALHLRPLGVANVFNLKSDWPHPNFTGSGLPAAREIGVDGFTAHWAIPNLVRNYPQFADLTEWAVPGDDAGNRPDLAEYTVGVELFEPVFHYSLLTRAVKYALLFIALTFLGVLLFEICSRRTETATRLHLVQYGIIGLGLALFYLVLLAASEHLGFTSAYLLAAGLNIVMVAGYVRAALASWPASFLVAGLQAVLYTALFFILNLEDYALLAGATLLVAATMALMAVTRNLGRKRRAISM